MRSLIIDGVDTYANLGLRLLSSTLSPPEPKTYVVDIPGGNGSIDITEALMGDVAFSNRQQEFTFATLQPREFETLKTRVSNLLHGRRLGYRLSWDPGYSYEGRFSVSSYELAPGIGRIVVKVDADPYKTKGLMTYRLNANGGRLYRFECGRKPVQPTIECSQPTKVFFDGKGVQLGIGTWRLNDIVFRQGWNELYINSLEMKTVTWDELKEGGAHAMTWAEAATRRWYDLDLLNVDGDSIKARAWDDLRNMRWSDLAETKWSQLKYQSATGADFTTYLSYEWSDL